MGSPPREKPHLHLRGKGKGEKGKNTYKGKASSLLTIKINEKINISGEVEWEAPNPPTKEEYTLPPPKFQRLAQGVCY